MQASELPHGQLMSLTHWGVVSGFYGIEAPAVLLAGAVLSNGVHVRFGAVALVLFEAVHLQKSKPMTSLRLLPTPPQLSLRTLGE